MLADKSLRLRLRGVHALLKLSWFLRRPPSFGVHALALTPQGKAILRRSVATIARKRLGEENWIQGRIMLGHVQPTTSDIYAVSDPAHLGRALAVTAALIEEIEALAPGAFYRSFTAHKNGGPPADQP
ncbi:MAG: hypothetical protein ACR2KH_02055 [Sphingomicrobium sp.]